MTFKLHAPFKPTGDQPEAIEKLVQGIQSGYKHQVLLGATGTGKSIGYDDPVFIVEQQDDKTVSRVLPIGEFFDNLYRESGSRFCREGDALIVDFSGEPRFYTQAIQPDDCSVSLYPIRSIICHDAPKEMYLLRTRCGRSVHLTGDHNLWVLREGQLRLIETADARPTDYLPIPESLSEGKTLEQIDVLKILDGERLFVESPEAILSFVDEHGAAAVARSLKNAGVNSPYGKLFAIRHHRRGRGIEVSTFRSLLRNTNELEGYWNAQRASVGGKRFRNRLPAQLLLTDSFLRLLGYYIAEGNSQDRYFVLANKDSHIRADIEAALKQPGIPFSVRASSDLQVSSAALTKLLSRLCGATAHTKRLPYFWSDLSEHALGQLLRGYFDGDGTVERASAITATTASEQLASDLAYALLRLGIWARISRRWKRATNAQHRGDWYFLLTISGQSDLHRFQRKIGFSVSYKRQKLNEQLQRTYNSNVDLVPIHGSRLRWLRHQLRISAKQVGEAAGLSRGAVQLIETGKRRPQRESLRRLLTALREFADQVEDLSEGWRQTWQRLFDLCRVRWTRIASIEQVEYTHPYVYDLSVPGAETFLAGAGGLFVHNTFTMANIIAAVNKPTLVMAHNKTLVAQLYAEFKEFFPENAVEYFVSYYDYYQPEAYVPRHDLYIEKETEINDEIERLRLAATTALLSRRDLIIVASVSCIYGLGSPEAYGKVVIDLEVGRSYRRNTLLRQLVESQYVRNDMDLKPGSFRVRGDTLEVAPAYEDRWVYRISFWGDEIERIAEVHYLTGEVRRQMERVSIYPAKHFITEEEKMKKAIADIEAELEERIAYFKANDMLLEAQRLEQRTRYDLEMLREAGYCSGIENYSRHLDQRPPGSPPWTLIDYFPDDYLLFIDESHMTVPQIRGMYNGDRARKTTLVEYGFRLPSALDNRPLQFDEFEERMGFTIYTSATPGPYELQHAGQVVEQIIRPTGLVDPQIEVRPVQGQVDDLIGEIHQRVERGQRVLVTTLTKRMAEDLSDYLMEMGIKVHYLHSEIDTLERVGILRDLRLGVFDVVVGINLLREGLDLPEVSLVAILDADKAGFLRSATALIQTIGRAARHVEGKVIMYADVISDAMRAAIDETERRRAKQIAYNRAHGIEPVSIVKGIRDITDQIAAHAVAEEQAEYRVGAAASLPQEEMRKVIAALESEMKTAAENLEFEKAAALRDQIFELRAILAEEGDYKPWEKIRLLAGED